MDQQLTVALDDARSEARRPTVDIVSAIDRRRGAFTRVIPNGEGSEYVITLLFEPATDPAAVATQMAVVNDELAAVRDACEAQTTGRAVKASEGRVGESQLN